MSGQSGGGGAGGYDISQSTSESSTTASRAGGSTFNVGGGLKIPQWVWAVVIGTGAVIALGWAWRTFTKSK